MADGHITREMLRAWAEGALPQGQLARFAADHLMSLCPFCRTEIHAFFLDKSHQGRSPQESSQLLMLLEQGARQAEKDLKEARRELAELLALPPDLRLPKMERAKARFQSPSLASLLLEESKKCIPADLPAALHFAQLANKVARCGPPNDSVRAGVLALTHAHLANAHRAQGDLQSAKRYMDMAHHNLRFDAVLDLAVRAEVASLEGSLLKDLRLFDLAVRELTQSVVLYRLIGRETDAARAMITLSGTHYYAGEILLAIETLEHALAGLSPEANPREYTFAQLNLVLYLCETADFQRARRWLEAAEPLYRGLTDEWTRLRVIWLEARIAAGLGELEAAEHGYRSAQAGFLGLGIAYDVAMVSLDLASLYLGQHRYSEIRQLAAEMVVLFEAQGVHREALAAVLLFERAAREENLSRALLRSVAKRLESTRSKPVGEAGEAS